MGTTGFVCVVVLAGSVDGGNGIGVGEFPIP